jgi:hypothetical protein
LLIVSVAEPAIVGLVLLVGLETALIVIAGGSLSIEKSLDETSEN